jgi:hypothetical protein
MPAGPNREASPRQDLQTIEEYSLEMQRLDYIGLRIMPEFRVNARTARFNRIRLDSLLSAGPEKLQRAAKSGYKRGDWDFVQDSFITQAHGVEEEIDDDEKMLYADYFDAELMAVQRCYERLFKSFETAALEETVAATVTAGFTDDAEAKWDVPATATPRADVKAARRRMWLRTGYTPNTMVISQWVLENLKDCQEVIDRMAGQGSGESSKPNEITTAKLAELFSVDQVLVAKAIQYDGDVSSIFPEDKALLLRTATSNSLKEPCYGRTFTFAGIHGNFQPTPFTYRQEEIECDIVRLKHEYELKVLYPEMAEVITGLKT